VSDSLPDKLSQFDTFKAFTGSQCARSQCDWFMRHALMIRLVGNQLKGLDLQLGRDMPLAVTTTVAHMQLHVYCTAQFMFT